ncbi:FecR domain-containing protein [Paenibacillus sp. 1P07SE]|uniref:FecR domain-containing protein n=1 Tax=Paenibacillus sp. 1P07SE TaxID=3132209 RepID=UPI0039A4F8B1
MNKGFYALRLLLVLVLAAAPLSLLAAPDETSAQIKRIAIVKELKGTVHVKKSGGSKTFTGFKNMTLNEGDTVTTGKGASVVLELSNSKAAQDTVTIAQNSQVTFTKLKDDKGSKTKMNVWAGSLWVKVQSISNASDQFELETPTAIMGVRGTNFLVSVSPSTGLSTVTPLSGIVTGKHNSKKSDTAVYPSQQITLLPGEEPEELVTIIDIEEFVSSAGPEIIEMIIRSADQIGEENDRLIEQTKQKLQNGDVPPPFLESPSDLERVLNNLDRLIGNIAREAVNQQKLSLEETRRLASEVNPDLPDKNKINLDDPKEIVKSPKEQEKLNQVQEKKKQLEAQKQREKDKLAAERDRQQELLAKLEAARKLQEEANRKAQEEAKKRATEELLNRLGASERERFERDKQLREQEQAPAPERPTFYPAPNPPVVSQPAARLVLSPDTGIAGSSFTVGLELNGFTGSRTIYGLQLRLAYDADRLRVDEEAFGRTDLAYRTGGGLFRIHPGNGTGTSYDSVDRYDTFEDGFYYSLMKYSGQAVSINTPTSVVKLPFRITGSGEAVQTIRIAELIAVDAAGRPIAGIDISHLDVRLASQTN